jgi:hypothetical protein
MAYPHLKVEEGKMKALPQKLTGSRSMVTPKQEEVPTRTAAAKKVITRGVMAACLMLMSVC